MFRLLLQPSYWIFSGSSKRWLLILLGAMTVWGIVDVRRRGYLCPERPWEHRTDLTVYTEAGAAFFDGRAPYEVANARGWTYLYPPLFAMLLAPLHVLAPQNQVLVWFFISLLFCWGCCLELRRLMHLVCEEEDQVAAAWSRWAYWLTAATIIVALLPTLNCLQRGQVGVVKAYLLLLGLRVTLAGRTRVGWFLGGLILAAPIVLKIVPALPVAFLLFLQLVLSTTRSWKPWVPRGRFGVQTLGVFAGLALFFFVVPAALIGWEANCRHLRTWSEFMLTKADDGGMDPKSGNSRSVRNQSLNNAAYRLGNFAAYSWLGGPSDQLVEEFGAPRMAMDSEAAERMLFLVRALLLLTLLAFGVRLMRDGGTKLDLAVGYSLACVAMLIVSPVARGHYFLLVAPAVLFAPLWFLRSGRPRVGLTLAALPPLLLLMHYVLLSSAGRIGLLGLGIAVWWMAAVVLMVRSQGGKTAGA